MSEQKCENCRFFDPNSPNSDSPYEGLCLRYPPQLSNNEKGLNFYFPMVNRSIHCGEWKPILNSGSISAYDEE